MSLAHDMWDRLQQAAYEAEQQQRSSPRGIIPMSRDQGAQVLNNLRTTSHYTPPPRTPIRPMTMEQGAQILHHLTSPPPPPQQPLPTPVKSFLQRFLR